MSLRFDNYVDNRGQMYMKLLKTNYIHDYVISNAPWQRVRIQMHYDDGKSQDDPAGLS